jgi:hypothetical protein
MSASLEALNRASHDHAFAIEAIDWSLAVDRAKPWAPDGLHPICFAPPTGGSAARRGCA